MRPLKPLKKLWDEKHAEERELLASALRRASSAHEAARMLEVSWSTFQRALGRHPDLAHGGDEHAGSTE